MAVTMHRPSTVAQSFILPVQGVGERNLARFAVHAQKTDQVRRQCRLVGGAVGVQPFGRTAGDQHQSAGTITRSCGQLVSQ